MTEQLLLYFGLGLLILALAAWRPDRQQSAPQDWPWDLAGLAATVLCIVFYENLIDAPVTALAYAWDAWDTRQTAMFSSWHPLALAAVYLLIADCGTYWVHRLLHYRWFWAQHAWHHSSRHLNIFSGLRGTLFHTVVSVAPYTIAAILIPVTAHDTTFLAILVLTIANQHYLHSNVKVPFSAQLEKFLMTPRAHFVHHAANPAISNSNYGTILTIWDHWFGTWINPDTIPADEPIGIHEDTPKWRMLLGLPDGGTESSSANVCADTRLQKT